MRLSDVSNVWPLQSTNNMAKKMASHWKTTIRLLTLTQPLSPSFFISHFFFLPFLLCLCYVSLFLFVYLCLTLYFPVSIFVFVLPFKKLFLSLLCGPFFLSLSTSRFLLSFRIWITFSVCLSLPHSYSFSLFSFLPFFLPFWRKSIILAKVFTFDPTPPFHSDNVHF